MEVVFTPWPYDAVARGAALLDEKVPGWRERIDVEKLYMEQPLHCIVGQACGGYMGGMHALGLEPWGAGHGVHYGFMSPDGSIRMDTRLEDAWREELAR
jgi:hypothetical protein